LLKAYSDPDAVANYADGPRRFVPGLSDLHRMTGLLLAERVPENARVLVLGAGGGLELKRWRKLTRDGRLSASTRRRRC
jgi:tRNA (cmo5U34)-methyltransferase